MEKLDFTPETLYRLPWNMADNSISWLEPTSQCNIHCDGCYRKNRKASHKTLAEIKRELEVFKKNRRTDSVSIAGGEPLIHPQIIEITRMIRDIGWKPVINTNGVALTRDLLKELKKAGVWGFTFHIDSGQTRPKWSGKNELELNELRLHYAEMLASVGDVSCSFNATIYPETLKYLPELAQWGQKHIDLVHVMVFILYRMAILDKGFDAFAGEKKVDFGEIEYSKYDDYRRTDITSPEAVEEIRKAYPDFQPCAFLNGTLKTNTYKWLLAGRMGNKHKIFGYVGPKFMELVQNFKHFVTDSYLAYSTPKMQRRGRSYFLMAPFDKGIREIIRNYFRSLKFNPKAFFSKVHYQSVMIIQPADVYENGDINMCDGCPDITVWDDDLVWSCRLEEQFKWGQNVKMIPAKTEEKVEIHDKGGK